MRVRSNHLFVILLAHLFRGPTAELQARSAVSECTAPPMSTLVPTASSLERRLDLCPRNGVWLCSGNDAIMFTVSVSKILFDYFNEMLVLCSFNPITITFQNQMKIIVSAIDTSSYLFSTPWTRPKPWWFRRSHLSPPCLTLFRGDRSAHHHRAHSGPVHVYTNPSRFLRLFLGTLPVGTHLSLELIDDVDQSIVLFSTPLV